MRESGTQVERELCEKGKKIGFGSNRCVKRDHIADIKQDRRREDETKPGKTVSVGKSEKRVTQFSHPKSGKGDEWGAMNTKYNGEGKKSREGWKGGWNYAASGTMGLKRRASSLIIERTKSGG